MLILSVVQYTVIFIHNGTFLIRIPAPEYVLKIKERPAGTHTEKRISRVLIISVNYYHLVIFPIRKYWYSVIFI